MDITNHIVYLYTLLNENTLDTIIADKLFKEFVYYARTMDFVLVKGSYFYETYLEDEYYTFEGVEHLLHGIITLVPNDTMIADRTAFVKKLEECINMYTLIKEMEFM